MSIYKKIIISLMVLISVNITTAFADPLNKVIEEGNQLYQKTDYKGALEKYRQAAGKEAESPLVNFNMGTAFYKTNEYADAVNSLEKALLTDDQTFRLRVAYNLGNAYYKKGIGFEGSDIDKAIAELEKSLKQYDGILKQTTDNPDTKFNHDFVNKELERLKQKKQQQQQQQNNQQQNQSQKDQPKKNQSEQNKSQQNQSEQNKTQQDQSQQQSSPDKQEQQEQASGQQNQQSTDAAKDNQSTQRQSQGENDTKDDKQPSAQSSDQKDEDKEKKNGEGQTATDQSSEQEKENTDSNPSAAGADGQKQLNPADLTVQEAQMLLNDYKQTEQPKKMLNFYRAKGKPQGTYKDW